MVKYWTETQFESRYVRWFYCWLVQEARLTQVLGKISEVGSMVPVRSEEKVVGQVGGNKKTLMRTVDAAKCISNLYVSRKSVGPVPQSL